MRSCIPYFIVLLLAILFLPLNAARAEQSEIEFFEKKIRPVLIKHCYKCHAADSASIKGGLLLDSRQGLITGGDSGTAIVSGKPDESLLIESLKYEGSEMPPDGKLPEGVIRDFEQWIKRGAIDPRKAKTSATQQADIDWEAARQFWSFRPLPVNRAHIKKISELSKNEKAKQIATLIDQHLDSSLKEAEIRTNPPATPQQRIRRLYYNMTGLPPSPTQVMAFVADPTKQRWENIVNKLLASPRFGQHWGRHWLDVARYADSNGGDFNATYHNAWRYRDYVIESFNNDKPINDFFQEQIAGDLLPAKDDKKKAEGLIATGFLMLGPKMLSERDKEKLRFDVIDEQVDTIGKVFLGISLGCARCHDHKFDPVPTEDYYALAGIFHGTQVLEGEMQQYVSNWKRRQLPTSNAHREALGRHQKKLDSLQQKMKEVKANLKVEQDKLSLLEENLHAITIDNTQAELIGEWTSSTYSKNFIGVDYLHDMKKDKGKKKVIFKAKLEQAGKYRILFAYNGSAGRDDNVPVSILFSGTETKRFIDESKKPDIRQSFVLLGEFDFPAHSDVQIVVSNEGTTGYVIADAVQFVRLDANLDMDAMNKQLAKLKQNQSVHQKTIKQVELQLASLKKQAPAPIPQAFAVQERQQCEDCSIHIRGSHTNLGDKVPRGVLKIISGENSLLNDLQGSGRLELAKWLTSDASPLVSRVFVNRVWMHLMGEGIVRSVDNFGTLGVAPTHPELLNELSLYFIENGWSQKDLVRAIVLTKAYQRSATHNAGSFQKDPANLLLWQANRRPLTSEQLHDSFLLFQNKIDETHGGSTVTHLGRLAVDNNKQANAKKTNKHILRRSVYQPVLRNQLEEIRQLFDFANPEMVVGKRAITNVPAQSLYLLNSEEIRKTAETIVDNLFAEHGDGSLAGLTELYLMLFAREPGQSEIELIKNYIDRKLNQQFEPKLVKAAWRDAVQALLISTEFRYID